MPLQESLIGFTTANAVKHAEIIRSTLETSTKSSYTLLSTTSMGGLLLFVFCLDELSALVESVVTASAGVGIFGLMGNKGAVGSRIIMKDGIIYTFVTAHLAAHDHGLLRRNEDYKNIVERLIFSTPTGESQIYDTSYCELFQPLLT